MKRQALNIAAFGWGFAEATLFFIVPDVLLSAAGLRRGARVGAWASLCAAVGAGAGGALMYAWAAADASAARAAVLAAPAVSEAMAANAAAAMAAHGWFLATLAGPLSTTPFKLYAVLAPGFDVGLLAFAGAGVLARLPRFLLAAMGGALIARWFGADKLVWLAGAWALFYAAFFALTPG